MVVGQRWWDNEQNRYDLWETKTILHQIIFVVTEKEKLPMKNHSN